MQHCTSLQFPKIAEIISEKLQLDNLKQSLRYIQIYICYVQLEQATLNSEFLDQTATHMPFKKQQSVLPVGSLSECFVTHRCMKVPLAGLYHHLFIWRLQVFIHYSSSKRAEIKWAVLSKDAISGLVTKTIKAEALSDILSCHDY